MLAESNRCNRCRQSSTVSGRDMGVLRLVKRNKTRYAKSRAYNGSGVRLQRNGFFCAKATSLTSRAKNPIRT